MGLGEGQALLLRLCGTIGAHKKFQHSQHQDIALKIV